MKVQKETKLLKVVELIKKDTLLAWNVALNEFGMTTELFTELVRFIKPNDRHWGIGARA